MLLLLTLIWSISLMLPILILNIGLFLWVDRFRIRKVDAPSKLQQSVTERLGRLLWTKRVKNSTISYTNSCVLTSRSTLASQCQYKCGSGSLMLAVLLSVHICPENICVVWLCAFVAVQVLYLSVDIFVLCHNRSTGAAVVHHHLDVVLETCMTEEEGEIHTSNSQT